MHVKFKLFSFLKVKVGKRERTFQLSKNATLEQAVDQLIEKTGVSSEDILEKGKLRRNLVVLINGKAVHDLNRKLSSGDTISLLPSIGGGKEVSLPNGFSIAIIDKLYWMALVWKNNDN